MIWVPVSCGSLEVFEVFLFYQTKMLLTHLLPGKANSMNTLWCDVMWEVHNVQWQLLKVAFLYVIDWPLVEGPRGEVNEKTRHISSLHFLVLFLACQIASPVKLKLHSDSALLHINCPHLDVCAYACAWAHCMHVHIRFLCESRRNHWCLMAVADSRFSFVLYFSFLPGLLLITAIRTTQQWFGHGKQPLQSLLLLITIATLHKKKPGQLHWEVMLTKVSKITLLYQQCRNTFDIFEFSKLSWA